MWRCVLSLLFIRLLDAYVKWRLCYAIYVVLERASDAIFRLHYTKQTDRFVAEPPLEYGTYDIASVELGLPKDVILFDNERPGVVRAVCHSGQNRLAIDVLSRTVFDSFYPLFCESIQDGTIIYDLPGRQCELTVPYSNNRRLGRIALHAKSPGAAEAVLDLDARLRRQSAEYDQLAAMTAAQVGNL